MSCRSAGLSKTSDKKRNSKSLRSQRRFANWIRAVTEETDLIFIRCGQCDLPVVPVILNSGSTREIAALVCPAGHGGIPVLSGLLDNGSPISSDPSPGSSS